MSNVYFHHRGEIYQLNEQQTSGLEALKKFFDMEFRDSVFVEFLIDGIKSRIEFNKIGYDIHKCGEDTFRITYINDFPPPQLPKGCKKVDYSEFERALNLKEQENFQS